jgi:hypothetical protein
LRSQLRIYRVIAEIPHRSSFEYRIGCPSGAVAEFFDAA